MKLKLLQQLSNLEKNMRCVKTGKKKVFADMVTSVCLLMMLHNSIHTLKLKMNKLRKKKKNPS